MQTYKYFLFLLIFSAVILPQRYRMTRDVDAAFIKGTRTHTGMPGTNYWQNHSDYKISVEVNPVTRLLSGSETVTYYNNSPDTLRNIVLRLYQNLHKFGVARHFDADKRDLHDGVEIKAFKYADSIYSVSNQRVFRSFATNTTVQLHKPIAPNASASIEIEWEFLIPFYSGVRMGAFDSTSYFIAYWYPQIAVYDDIDGWDNIPYGGQQEFYNDFNNYDVSITMPNNYGVWATGVLQNAKEVLTPKILERYNKAKSSSEVVKIVTSDDFNEKVYSDKTKKNSWHFVAEKVPDYAFAFSDHYLWDAVTADIGEGKKVFAGAAYNRKSNDFYEVASIAQKTIESFSKSFPAVPFPYPCLTVYNGSGGMEYPMMVNDGSASTRAGTVGVTTHEIAHTYFPFYMGINEKKYAWMDEGWAVMLPFDLQTELESSSGQVIGNAKSFGRVAGSSFDLPLTVPTSQMIGNTYRIAAYSRPGMAYYFLREALGKEKFTAALKEYMRRWNGKHPLPLDFFNTFEDYTQEDLSWFINPWFYTNAHPDLKIAEAKVSGDEVTVVIEKAGGLPVPINLSILVDGKDKITAYESCAIWKDGRTKHTIKTKVEGKVQSVHLADLTIPDSDYNNNDFEFSK